MQVLDFIQNNLRSDFLDIIMPIITYLGSGGIIWILAALIFISLKKYRLMGISMIVALILSLLIGNVILKPLIARIRPFEVNTAIELLIGPPTDYSFPSGHTLSSFAVAIAVFCLNKRFGVIALVFASIIAFSRLYLYVHYPSDVFGGFVIGVSIGFFANFITKRLNEKVIIKHTKLNRWFC